MGAGERSRRRPGACRGSVTLEFAGLLPVVLVTVVALVWLAGAVTDQLRCADAARDVARELARGSAPTAALRLGTAEAPAGASVRAQREGPDVVVQVGVVTRGPGLLAGVARLRVGATSRIRAEDAGPS